MTQVQLVQPALPSGALNYARDGRKRRRSRLRILLLAIILLLAGTAWWWRVPLKGHAQLHYAQYQCANHEFPPGTLVALTGTTLSEFSAQDPACWTEYHRQGGFTGATGTGRTRLPRTIAFLHQLRSPSGQERIIAVGCYPHYLSSASILQAFEPVSVSPAAFRSFSSRPAASLGKLNAGYPVGFKIEVFGGQPDPNDPSRFTIDYKMLDVPGVIEGQLLDNGDVALNLRPGSPDGMDRYKKKSP